MRFPTKYNTKQKVIKGHRPFFGDPQKKKKGSPLSFLVEWSSLALGRGRAKATGKTIIRRSSPDVFPYNNNQAQEVASYSSRGAQKRKGFLILYSYIRASQMIWKDERAKIWGDETDFFVRIIYPVCQTIKSNSKTNKKAWVKSIISDIWSMESGCLLLLGLLRLLLLGWEGWEGGLSRK